MEYLIVGLAVFFNIATIKRKFEKHQIANAVLDAVVLLGVTVVFSGSYGALVVGTIASAMFSIYLMWSPLKLGGDSKSKSISEWLKSLEAK